ncbi:FUSC family protein [Shewanella yunxiaonensis]|uniref:FUSC family protein n=1 Tax=Shewanella yunxiaonensis TaxID=2829809 RepID=A0ABX7YVU0_9GAMM|nr:FUSC family protein [Shewanella yunxiaonensis]QUN06608.1 FUSC family protein [Shewanella yunxiaonensis]
MTLSPVQSVFLTPDKRTLIFAIKGIISMTLALYAAMYLNLDRPYWALISAVFLQIRPEAGLVIEKGLMQIIGTLIGGAVGIAILQAFAGYPELAILSLALWLGINAGFSAMVRSINFIYAFAMAGITPCLVVLLVMVSPATATSDAIFQVAQSRVSEIILGAICAMLVSLLLWPQTVASGLRQQARIVINQTLDYLAQELAPEGSHEQRHQFIDNILEQLAAFNDDSSAVVYEGPEGPGRGRAANMMCNKVLSLLAVVQIFGRLQRNHPEQLSPALHTMLQELRHSFAQMSASRDYDEAYQLAQQQRRKLIHLRNQLPCGQPLQNRLLKVASELISDLVMVLKAYDALENSTTQMSNALALRPHRDPLVGLTTGFRTAVLFLIGAGIWIGTAASSALMLMILPVIFSMMMARLPLTLLMVVLRRLLVGVAISTPLAIFFALNLLAQSSGDFEILILVMAGPFFIGLMALANRPTLPYGLGLCIPFVILVRPANDMSYAFSIGYTLSNAFAIAVGVTILYWLFKLITGPGIPLMQRRLIQATADDLLEISEHVEQEDWFNARMGDRLLRLANYDKAAADNAREMTDLGLTGLNLGHISVRLRRLLQSVSDQRLEPLLDNWQQALAQAFLASSKGQQYPAFKTSSTALLEAIHEDQLSPEQLEMIEGMFTRVSLTFERTANTMAQKIVNA